MHVSFSEVLSLLKNINLEFWYLAVGFSAVARDYYITHGFWDTILSLITGFYYIFIKEEVGINMFLFIYIELIISNWTFEN